MTRKYQFSEYKKGNILSYLKSNNQSTLYDDQQIVLYYSEENEAKIGLTMVVVPQERAHKVFIFVDDYLSYAIFDGTKYYYINLGKFVISNEKASRPSYLQTGMHQIKAAQFSNDNPNTGKLISITTESYMIKDKPEQLD